LLANAKHDRLLLRIGGRVSSAHSYRAWHALASNSADAQRGDVFAVHRSTASREHVIEISGPKVDITCHTGRIRSPFVWARIREDNNSAADGRSKYKPVMRALGAPLRNITF